MFNPYQLQLPILQQLQSAKVFPEVRCPECGAKPRWESRKQWNYTAWVGWCQTPACGAYLCLREDRDGVLEALSLEDALLSTPLARPVARPWMRLFLEGAEIHDGCSWQPDAEPCRACQELGTVMRLSLSPQRDPYEVTICIDCGVVSATNQHESGWRTGHGGEDWAAADPVVDQVRRGIRRRRERARRTPSDSVWSWS